MSTADKPEKSAEEKQAEFEKNAWDLAVYFKRDAHDIKGAFTDKRESLKHAFNQVSESKFWRNANIALTVLVLATPLRFVALVPAAIAYWQQRRIEAAGKQIGYEVTRYKALPAPEKPAEPPKPPAPLI